MLPNKEILFKKFVPRFNLLKVTFENSKKVRFTHFNISVEVNASETINQRLKSNWNLIPDFLKNNGDLFLLQKLEKIN